MRKSVSLLGTLALVAILGVGCAGPEAKLGRGISNMGEIVRGGEFSRSVEQGALFDGTDVGYTTGVVRGINRTLARTGLGVYEVVTSPFPPYEPVWTDYLTPKPQYPDANQPTKVADPIFDADHYSGFSGGNPAPILPGSKFTVFDN